MACVPTWTELRLDATKLAQMQRECNRSVHNLLYLAIPELDRKLSILSGIEETRPSETKPPPSETKPPPSETKPSPKRYSKTDLEGLEHLKPLPLTPSEYLKINRPRMVKNADERVMHLKKRAERRKYLSAARTINALEQLRLDSRKSNKGRESVAPSYQVKCKMSEKEMRRLTARVYNTLPEVEKQRTEEVTKHMKVQNYKNKLEYGRRLLENRKHGVINYPLRPNYDDSSLIGSHDSSITSSGDQSSDAFRFDSY